MPQSDFPESGKAPAAQGADAAALCDLAGLRLDPSELTRLSRDLEQILTYVRLIDEADSAGRLPTIHPTQARATLRADEIHGGLTASDALRNAPRTKGDYFRAPPAIPQGEDLRD